MSKYSDIAFNRNPEYLRGDNTKNLYHVLYPDVGVFDGLFEDVINSRNIDKASGKSLDLLGENVGQIRQGEDDELYRRLIKVRIIANLSNGDIPTMNYVLSILVKEVYNGLEEAWRYDKYDNEPAAIVLKITDFMRNFPFEIIEKIKSAGVKVLLALDVPQYIYYAMANQERKKITVYPREAEDIVGNLMPRFGAGAYAYKVKYKDKPIEVWTTDKYGFMTEVTGVNGEVLKYGRDTR